MGNQSVVNFIRERIAAGKALTSICEEIMDWCLSPSVSKNGAIGCDNMTIIIVLLLHGKPVEEAIAKCKKPAVGTVPDFDYGATKNSSVDNDDN